VGGTPAEVSAVAAELLRRGVVANVEVNDDESTSLWYRNPDVASMVQRRAGRGPWALTQALFAKRLIDDQDPLVLSEEGDDG
jgi:hypothetical protein